MPERALKLILTLLLVLFLVHLLVDVAGRMLEAALMAVASVVRWAGSVFGGLLVAVLLVCFTVGLFAQFVRFVTTRDPRAARDRVSRERAMRQCVRRPAEGVPPLHAYRDHQPDPDPAVDEGER